MKTPKPILTLIIVMMATMVAFAMLVRIYNPGLKLLRIS